MLLACSVSMIERGVHGSIVNIVSTAGHQGQPGNVAYCTAKMGLMNFTSSVAMELAPHIDHMVLFSGDGDFRSLVEVTA